MEPSVPVTLSLPTISSPSIVPQTTVSNVTSVPTGAAVAASTTPPSSQASSQLLLQQQHEKEMRRKRLLEEEEREKMRVLVSNFSEDQLNRYEMFRRAAFPKAAVKRVSDSTVHNLI